MRPSLAPFRSTPWIGLLVLCLSTYVWGGPLPEGELQELFIQGKALFRQANQAAGTDPDTAKELYRKAALRFERIIRDGKVRNGKLYYNIGNAFFRMGDLGRAILHYRRSERYRPHDPNLQQNLNYARTRRLDRIEERQKTKVLKTLLFWHYDISAGTRSVIFAVGSLLFWVGLSLRIFSRKSIPRWALACLGLIALLFLASLVFEGFFADRQREGVILAKHVLARKGDGETYQSSFKDPLHAGTEFEVLEDRNKWYQIELRDGRRCWVPHSAAELVW
jgi:tetratricopeptide (TPR) repeat protein